VSPPALRLYMLDDNWFTVAADWPEDYEPSFGPSSETRRVFTELMRRCDAVSSTANCSNATSTPGEAVFRLRLNVNVRQFVPWRSARKEDLSATGRLLGQPQVHRRRVQWTEGVSPEVALYDLLWLGSPPAYVTEGYPRIGFAWHRMS